MDFRVIKKEQQMESNWSGGRTLELAIFPERAKYLDRDFLWRLSTACSDRDESSFTKLEDYDRILMVLEGDVVLAYGDQRSAHLEAMQQDAFDGAVKTRCFGKLIRDYNLIHVKGSRARMEVKQLQSAAAPVEMSSEALESVASYGIFCLDGYAVVTCGETSEMIRPDEQAVIDFPNGVEGDIRLMGEGRCIVTEILMGPAGGKGEESGDAKAGPAEAEDGETAAAQAKNAAGDKGDSSAFEDYLTSLKLYFGRNRWVMIMRREGMAKTYYDREMSEKLKKLERWFIVEAVWLIGVLLCMMPLFRGADPVTSLIAAVLFTVIHIFGILPGIYMTWLPRPFSRHMKKVSETNAAERAYLQEETGEDLHFQRLMQKYRSDDENYFTDESSPLYHLTKKK